MNRISHECLDLEPQNTQYCYCAIFRPDACENRQSNLLIDKCRRKKWVCTYTDFLVLFHRWRMGKKWTWIFSKILIQKVMGECDPAEMKWLRFGPFRHFNCQVSPTQTPANFIFVKDCPEMDALSLYKGQLFPWVPYWPVEIDSYKWGRFN